MKSKNIAKEELMMEVDFISIIQKSDSDFKQFVMKYIGEIDEIDEKAFEGLVHFLIYDKPWLYDFKNEEYDRSYSESIYEDVQEGRNIKNYFDNKVNVNARHCDSCTLAKILYKFLWNWPLKKNKNVNGLIELGNNEAEKKRVLCAPDTMNSFFHIFHWVLTREKRFDRDFFASLKGQRRGSSYYEWLRDNVSSIRDKLVMNKSEEEKTEEEKIEERIFKELNKFALLTHTIGNFVLVPPAWNVGRNSMFGDYFDIFLDNWKSGNLLLDTKLLGKYREKLCLNMETDNKIVCSYLDEKKVERPNSMKEMLGYIEKVNDFIEWRGEFLVKKLFENMQFEYCKYKNINYRELREPMDVNDITIPVVVDEVEGNYVRTIFFKIDLKNDFRTPEQELLFEYIRDKGCILHDGEVIVCKPLTTSRFDEQEDFEKIFDFFEQEDFEKIFDFFEQEDFAIINVDSIIFPKAVFRTNEIERGELYRIPRSLFEIAFDEEDRCRDNTFKDYIEKVSRSEEEEKAFYEWSQKKTKE